MSIWVTPWQVLSPTSEGEGDGEDGQEGQDGAATATGDGDRGNRKLCPGSPGEEGQRGRGCGEGGSSREGLGVEPPLWGGDSGEFQVGWWR